MCKKITIIIPVFNGEKYIERCIKNVLNQCYDNYEAILIDDGSTDSTRLICDQYVQKDNRIFVYTQKNSVRQEIEGWQWQQESLFVLWTVMIKSMKII